MINYTLISQKIISIAQNSNVFAFNLSTLQAIDSKVASLQDAQANLEPLLISSNIIVLLSTKDSLLVFLKGGRSTYDLIPKNLTGSQFQVQNSFDSSMLLYNPVSTLSDPNDLVIDARCYKVPIPEYKGHNIVVGGNATIAGFSHWQKYALSLNTSGYLMVPASPDLIYDGNYTHCINFSGALTSLSYQNTGAYSVIDTRNSQGEGFLLEMLIVQTGPVTTTTWHFYTNGQDYFSVYPTTSVQQWTRVAIVKQGPAINIFINGQIDSHLSNISASKVSTPYNILLGIYSAPIVTNDGHTYLRPVVSNNVPTITDSNLIIESYRYVKEAMYGANYNYLTAY